MEVLVHKRVTERHPELSESDVVHAWEHAFAVVERSGERIYDTVFAGVGADTKGRLLEFVAQVRYDGVVVIFHSMTPPSRKLLSELGME